MTSMISSVPRFLISFITRNQSLAPSFCSTHMPSASLPLLARTVQLFVKRMRASAPLVFEPKVIMEIF